MNNNFIHINNPNNELVYISVCYANYGRIKHNFSPMGAEIFYNEHLSDEFYIDLESKAIEIIASAGECDFTFNIICLKKQLENCLKAFKQMLDFNDFKDLEKIKFKIKNYFLAEFQEYDSLAKMKLYENFFKAPFKNSKYGDFDNFNDEDFKNYIKNLKNQANKIVISADLNETELNNIRQFLNNKNINYDTLEYNKSFFLKENKNISRSFIRICSPCIISSKKEKVAMSLAGFILGGGFGSRITEEIRVKRGLAYTAYAMLAAIKQSYFFTGLLQTKLSSEKEAIKIIKDEFNKIIDFGINIDEFNKAKEFLIGSEILKYATIEKRHNIACSEIFSNYDLGESRKNIEILKALSLNECNEILSKKQEIEDLSFFVVSKNE